MQKPKKVDLTKLLGFETVTNEPTDDIDFQDETLSAKLGAKVGSIIEATEPGRGNIYRMDFDKKGVGFGRPPFFCAARFLVSARSAGRLRLLMRDTRYYRVSGEVWHCMPTYTRWPSANYVIQHSCPTRRQSCPECRIKEERLQVEKFFEDSE